ncbi:MAG: hypothetical protein ACO1OG_11765 [Devosia sp.]
MKLVLLSAIAALTITSAVAAAEFPSRVVLKIGATTTSSWTVVAGVVADHIGRFLPGEPTIETETVDTARGMQLSRQMVETEPTDGSVFSTMSTSIIQNYILDPSIYDFSPAGVHWIGSLAKTTSYCVAKVGSGKTISTEGLILGASTKQSNFYTNGAMIKRLVNPSISIIVGFENENELMAALDRGEIDAYCGPTRSTYEREQRASAQEVIGGLGRPEILAELGLHDVFDGVTGIDRQAVDLALSSTVLFYGMILPPDAAPELVEIYRAAFIAMNADSAFQADIKAKLTEYAPMEGPETQAFMQAILDADPAIVAHAVDLMK